VNDARDRLKSGKAEDFNLTNQGKGPVSNPAVGLSETERMKVFQKAKQSEKEARDVYRRGGKSTVREEEIRYTDSHGRRQIKIKFIRQTTYKNKDGVLAIKNHICGMEKNGKMLYGTRA